jgi:hypothetical protein
VASPSDTHYDTLGVEPDADQPTIRAAYRALARRLHPDAGRADASAMAALNEAYRVLGEPARRAQYDARLRSPPAPTRPARPSAAPASERTVSTGRAGFAAPARYPWKLVIGMFALGAAAVLVMAALAEPSRPAPADNLLEAGSCVVVEPNGDAREVVCDGRDQRVVVALVPTGEACPTGTDAHRDRQGRGTACLRAEPSASIPDGP